VLFFLWAKELNTKDIHKEMFPVYGGKCLSRKAVHNRVEKFSQGRSKVTDGARPEATVQRVEELIQVERRIRIDSVAIALGCSRGLAYGILRGLLKFRKVCPWSLPRELKNREKN
jgi:hypothetical protein